MSGERPGRAFELGDLKAAFKRFQDDQITDNAAALTYYSLLSLFPALLFAVAALGVFGQQGLIDEAADVPHGRGRAGVDRQLGHGRAGVRAVAARDRAHRAS